MKRIQLLIHQKFSIKKKKKGKQSINVKNSEDVGYKFKHNRIIKEKYNIKEISWERQTVGSGIALATVSSISALNCPHKDLHCTGVISVLFGGT